MMAPDKKHHTRKFSIRETNSDEGLISPRDLRRITEEKEMARIRAVLEQQKKLEAEQQELHEAFMEQHIQPDSRRRFTDAVRRAAERGENEIQILRFPSAFCNDGGRAINNLEEDWGNTLTGIAREAYEAWQQNLQPLGYKLHALILNFPKGMPGDVGMFLRW